MTKQPVDRMSEADIRIRDAIASDSPLALEMIWEQYGHRLFMFLVAYLRSHHDAEEVMQDVFVKIARDKAKLLGATHLGAYLFRMARNEAVSLIRRRARRETPVAPQDGWVLPAETCNADPKRADRAAAMLVRLPEDQRTVIILKIYRDMTFQEIADDLAISLNTAASRYRYGMEKLRSFMQEEIR